MAHKALIGGTAYEISGGKTLVNGTAYSITVGNTLVDGTGYEIGFAPEIGIFILRPSADVSLGHTKYPTSLSAGYLAINEETCDNGSTYIKASSGAYANTAITSTFKFSGNIPSKLVAIKSAKIVYAPYRDNSGAASMVITVSVNGMSFNSETIDLAGSFWNYVAQELTIGGLVDAINDYALTIENGILEVDVAVTNRQTYAIGSKDSEATHTHISQMYIELECEYLA